MEKLVIVGGGVAGLSCLNALLDRNVDALLIEGGVIGTPKICGEFLAPAAVNLLQRWNMGPIQEIQQVKFYGANKEYHLNFPKVAGAISREAVELQLAKRALQLGARIKENSPIQKIIPGTEQSPYQIYLSSDQMIETNSVIFATGKFNQMNGQARPVYYGIKMHIEKIVTPATLQMFCIKGGYFGIVPISQTISNCAGLIKRAEVEKYNSCKDYIFHCIKTNKYLSSIFASIDLDKIVYLEGLTSEFTLKQHPNWPRAFWIGDAMATLYPAIGSGFAHSITNAILAAEAYIDSNSFAFHKTAVRNVKPKLRYGKLLHQLLLLNPLFESILIDFIRYNPWLSKLLLKKFEYI